MSQPFAVGSKALGICDRCGFTYLLHDLKNQVVALHASGLLVCPTCLDKDQPQLELGRWPVSDPQALRIARPNTGDEASRFGDAVRYDFLTNNDGWSGGEFAEVAYVAADSALGLDGSITVTGDSLTPKITKSVVINTTIYNKVSMRIRRTVEPSISANWLGQFSWTGDGSGSVSVSQPVWNQMGDPYTVMTWDMSNVSGWTGGTATLEFALFSFGSLPGTNITVQIDYIRIQNWSDQS